MQNVLNVFSMPIHILQCVFHVEKLSTLYSHTSRAVQNVLNVFSMPIHILQCVFHIEKLFCTHRFFHKYEQICTEKFAHALLLILMREVYLQRWMMSKYSR